MHRKLITLAALALAPAVALAQGGTTSTSGDSAQLGTGAATTQQTQGMQAQADTTGAMSHRHVGSRTGLSHSQVRQLQTALNSAGCNAGTPDGRFGPKTEQAIQCYRQQKNLSGNASELYSSLGLNFGSQAGTSTVTSGGEISSGSDTSSGSQNVRGTARQTGGKNKGRIRPPADTTTNAPPPTESPRAAQHGQGMHDSTTSKSTGNATDTTGAAGRSDTTMNTSNGSIATDTSSSMRRDTSSSMRRTDTSAATGNAQNPTSTTPVNVAPVDSTRLGTPATKQMQRNDSTNAAKRDTTKPPTR
jgi:hypothetical protein